MNAQPKKGNTVDTVDREEVKKHGGATITNR
jgi:hypothetical protein